MSLQPTFTGHVDSTHDALILFQATLDGKLPAVSRRPHDRERSELVKSGSVFVFNENSSGIKRWTDGIAWSPSRILGNFLVYRQLEKPFTPGEKKQTNKRPRRKRTPSSSSGSTPYSRSSPGREEDVKYPMTSGGAPGSVTGSSLPINIELPNQDLSPSGIPIERNLVGSLVDSYGFKKDGLIKKTISIMIDNIQHHLVSYYKPDDVMAGIFEQPSKCAFLKDITISDELIHRQNFRIPLEPGQGPSGQTLIESTAGFQSRSAALQQQQQQQQSYLLNPQATALGAQAAPSAPVSTYQDLSYDLETFSSFDSTGMGRTTLVKTESSPQSAYYRSPHQISQSSSSSTAMSMSSTATAPTSSSHSGVHQQPQSPTQSHSQQQLTTNGYISNFRQFNNGANFSSVTHQHLTPQYLSTSASTGTPSTHDYYQSQLPPPSQYYSQPVRSSSATSSTTSNGTHSSSLTSSSTDSTALSYGSQSQPSYSYGQIYATHDYHIDPQAGVSDPRRLPDVSVTATHALTGASSAVAASSGLQRNNISVLASGQPSPVHQQPVHSQVSYNYNYTNYR